MSVLTLASYGLLCECIDMASYGLLCECIDNSFIWTALGVH